MVEPVLDTSDLAAIAALPLPEPPEPIPYGGNLDRAELRRKQNARYWYRWVAEARQLAAAGVTPAPSHVRFRPDGELYVTVQGGFTPVEVLLEERVQAGVAFPGSHLALFGVEVGGQGDELEIPDLPAGYPWRAVVQQSAGLACHQRRFVGVVLDIRPEAERITHALANFADEGGHRCIGIGGLLLSDLVSYAALCKRIGVSAEYSWDGLEEACYPLDESAAAVLSDTPIPSLDARLQLIESGAAGLETVLMSLREIGSRQWRVWVFGENCD